jgi:hypothetical protein
MACISDDNDDCILHFIDVPSSIHSFDVPFFYSIHIPLHLLYVLLRSSFIHPTKSAVISQDDE